VNNNIVVLSSIFLIGITDISSNKLNVYLKKCFMLNATISYIVKSEN